MLFRISFIAVAFLLAAESMYAQGIPSDASPLSLALGQSEIASPQDEWSPNPALRADSVSHIRTMLAPAPNNLSGSWTAGANGDFEIDGGVTFGASFARNEYSDIGYSWESFDAQASKTFHISDTGTHARFASVGVRMRYAEEVFGGTVTYLPLDEMTADFGATFDLFPELTAGVTVTHLFTIYNNQDVPMEQRAAWLGLTYRPLGELTLHASMGPIDTSIEFHIGVQYEFDQYLFIRAGTIIGSNARTDAGQITGGFGVMSGTFIADFSAVRDPNLGTTVCFGIGFDL